MMTLEIRWRKAITASFLFHLLFIALAGQLASRLFVLPPIIEQYIEIDLASSEQPAIPEAAAPPSPTIPETVTTEVTPPLAQPIVTSIETLSMTEVENVAAIDPTPQAMPASTTRNTTAVDGNRTRITPPKILAKTEPVYPSSARQAGIQGTVIVKIQISEQGRPVNVFVVNSSGHDVLDSAAVAAVQQWQFVPAKDQTNGRSVACSSTLPITFRLK